MTEQRTMPDLYDDTEFWRRFQVSQVGKSGELRGRDVVITNVTVVGRAVHDEKYRVHARDEREAREAVASVFANPRQPANAAAGELPHKLHAIANAARAYAAAMDDVTTASDDSTLIVAGHALRAALALPEPHWSKEPPTVDGWYWLRAPLVGCVSAHNRDAGTWLISDTEEGPDEELVKLGYEFWPVPLELPRG